MGIRDLIVIGIVVAASLWALRRPWIGVLLWTWLSLMNPHRFTYGWAYSMPLAAMAAAATLVGLLATRDRQSPFQGAPTIWLALLMFWMTLSWLFGLDPAGDYAQWEKVIKIDLMVLVALALLMTKQHILAFAWVCALSLALLGIKGGIFTLATAGNYRVWGPPGSFIQDNNEFALSLIMTIPLLRFLQLQFAPGWHRHLMTAAMLLCAAAALGTHSRGALLAIVAMSTVLWLRGNRKMLAGVVIVLAGIMLVTFMPDHWTERMATIQEYDEDLSARGRFSAWWTAWGIAKDYPFGVGFYTYRAELFAMYSPWPDHLAAAHSIYFQMLGNHGFGGLFLFLGVFVSTFLLAGRLRKMARNTPEAQWCANLGSMVQVSLVGYAVGGAFLSLSYFDLPYNLMVLVVLTHRWMIRRGWQSDPVVIKRRLQVPGVLSPGYLQ